MNEASSKFVDLIATEKLIDEKLSRVHHAPEDKYDQAFFNFSDFSNLPVPAHQVIETPSDHGIEITFPSFIQSKYKENNLVRGQCYCADDPTGDLIFLHGLYEDNLEIYAYFISLLNKQGLNVHLLKLPYHYDRRPAESLFSGEYFWSANVGRSALAYKQAVYDTYQLYRYVQSKSGKPVCIVGFSMGGGIGLTLASIAPLDGLFAINPVCNISKLTWNSALFSSIREDLEAHEIGLSELKASFRWYEPLAVQSIETDSERVAVARSLYDQINDPENYDLLVSRWHITKDLSYKAGHLNILRVPRLAGDVVRFAVGEPVT